MRRHVIRWALAALAVAVLCASALAGGQARREAPCTHGLSSLGPVELSDGQVVGGSTTPVTEACLP